MLAAAFRISIQNSVIPQFEFDKGKNKLAGVQLRRTGRQKPKSNPSISAKSKQVFCSIFRKIATPIVQNKHVTFIQIFLLQKLAYNTIEIILGGVFELILKSTAKGTDRFGSKVLISVNVYEVSNVYGLTIISVSKIGPIAFCLIKTLGLK